jgi:hypothetical protein
VSTAQDIIDRVRVELNDDDPDTKRYSDAKLLGFLTLAQRELVRIKPEANAKADTFTIGLPRARQRLGCEYFAILRVDANLDTSVAAPHPLGTAIRTVERDVLDTFYAAWPRSAQPSSANATRYKIAATDKSDPLAFWLFPAPITGHAVAITAVRIPAEVAAPASALELNDVYIPALTQYVCHLALVSEQRAEGADNSSKYLDAFLALLGKTREVLRQLGPDQPRAPEANQ